MEATFPAVFYDGECETNIGDITIFPSLDYESLRSILSCKIGINPNRFSVYLADNDRSCRSRIPITRKTDFSAISQLEECCFFLVTMRRSRDSHLRRQRRKQQPPGIGTVRYLLKRNGGAIRIDNVKNLLSDENSEKSVNMKENNYIVVCEDCVRAKEISKEFGFHWCKYDAVITFGFRSPAGPIARPVKQYHNN